MHGVHRWSGCSCMISFFPQMPCLLPHIPNDFRLPASPCPQTQTFGQSSGLKAWIKPCRRMESAAIRLLYFYLYSRCAPMTLIFRKYWITSLFFSMDKDTFKFLKSYHSCAEQVLFIQQLPWSNKNKTPQIPVHVWIHFTSEKQMHEFSVQSLWRHNNNFNNSGL